MRVHETRLEGLAELMVESNIDLILLTSRANVKYFTGYGGEGVAVVSSDGMATLYVEPIHLGEAEGSAADRISVIAVQRIEEPLDAAVKELSQKRITLGADALTMEKYTELISSYNLVIKPAGNLIWKLRTKKDQWEKELIQKTASIVESAMEMAFDLLVSDSQITEVKALVIEELMRRGADEIPATPVIAPAKQTYQRGDTLTLTVSALKDDYVAKLTRTITVGHETNEGIKDACNTLVEWFEACSEKIKAWSPGLEVFDLLKDRISVFEDVAISRVIGHGIGLELLEPPEITQTSRELLPEDAVIVIQPKILLRNSTWLSVGDVYAVEKDGLVKLSKLDYIL